MDFMSMMTGKWFWMWLSVQGGNGMTQDSVYPDCLGIPDS
jgi:hypothetical protein